jgi:ABC-type glycerol-3-phosphate transport system permease component
MASADRTLALPRPGSARRASRLAWDRLGLYLLVALIVVSVAAPLLWILKISIVETRELSASPPTLWPHTFTLSHYEKVFGDPLFLRSLLNSVIIAGATTAVALTIGALAAYPLARLEFRFRGLVMTGILAISFFPMVAIIAPLFVQFRSLGLLDTYWAVIATDTVFVLPLSVWILATFFRQLPRDLENAARIDGASPLQAFRLVILPLAAPGVMTAAILTFIATWNEYLFANTFLFDNHKWPVTVLIPNFAANQFTPDYAAQAAAALVVTAPILILVLVLQRRIVSGLTAGALSG